MEAALERNLREHLNTAEACHNFVWLKAYGDDETVLITTQIVLNKGNKRSRTRFLHHLVVLCCGTSEYRMF